MKQEKTTTGHIELIKTYFRKVDNRSLELDRLFAEDVEIFFPKFGTGKGKDKLNEFGRGMKNFLSRLTHEIEDFRYTVSGNTVVVEGTESGSLKNGKFFTKNRFCSVFEINDTLISRMYIYTDPDFPGEDEQRFRWGTPNK